MKSQGNPQAAIPAVAPTVIVTTQRTGKFWKLQLLLSALVAIGGAVALCVAYNGDGQSSVMVGGGVALAIGIVWFIIARIGAWWFHG